MGILNRALLPLPSKVWGHRCAPLCPVFWGPGDWTRGFGHVSQVFCHLSYILGQVSISFPDSMGSTSQDLKAQDATHLLRVFPAKCSNKCHWNLIVAWTAGNCPFGAILDWHNNSDFTMAFAVLQITALASCVSAKKAIQLWAMLSQKPVPGCAYRKGPWASMTHPKGIFRENSQWKRIKQNSQEGKNKSQCFSNIIILKSYKMVVKSICGLNCQP